MRRFDKNKRECSTTFESECCIDNMEYEVTFVVDWDHDSNYGADADGNRGVPMDFIEIDEIIKLEAVVNAGVSSRKRVLRKFDLNKLPEKLEKWMNEALDKYIGNGDYSDAFIPDEPPDRDDY